MKQGLTLLEVFALYIGLPSKGKRTFSKKYWQSTLAWPPNLFAVCSAILSETGVYVKLVSPNSSITEIYKDGLQGQNLDQLSHSWKKNIYKQEKCVGHIWNNGTNVSDILLKSSILPLPVRNLISQIFDESNQLKSIKELSDDAEFIASILFLLSLADETCAGFGVDTTESWDNNEEHQSLLLFVDLILHENERQSLATFCTNRMTVLPKSLTATVGISLQSLSHHLAFISGEVSAFWNDIKIDSENPSHKNKENLNVLIIPYPYSVKSEQFKEKLDAPHKPKAAKYFTYQPNPNLSHLVELTKDLVSKSRSSSHEVDLIVFPEATFRQSIFKDYLRLMNEYFDEIGVKHKPVFIAGVVDKIISNTKVTQFASEGFDERNCSVLVPPHRYENEHILNKSTLKGMGYEQVKHHRWQLDHNQISMYGIGTELSAQPGEIFWEGISLENRRVIFTQWEDWFSVCTLICEDLARQEPVSSAIRSVGPNLIIALLFDGPQKKYRWPGRHATTFSEEPGSSVLTVTALGMCQRSIPKIPNFKLDSDTSRTVALWRDKYIGEKELILQEGDHGILLELSSIMSEQISADCRTDNCMSVFLTYRNHFCIHSDYEARMSKNVEKNECA